MRDLSATEAARKFASVLDDVEHRGESFTVVRNGRPVAQILPVSKPNGRAVLEFLTSHQPDPQWADDLRQLRAELFIEERDWPA